MKTRFAILSLILVTLSSAVYAKYQSIQKEKVTTVSDSLQVKPAEKPEIKVHQTFKGIPLCGTEVEFTNKLMAKGYKLEGKALKGSFSGYTVTVIPETTYTSKQLYRANAICPTRSSWNEVKKDFRIFQMNLTTKYGKPYRETWQFITPYVEGDGYEWKAFVEDKAKCNSTWQTELGEIRISIENNSNGLYLRIVYSDYEGYRIDESERNKSFLEDL